MEHIIPIASDHGGFEMKQYLIEKLTEAGYKVDDYGTYTPDSVDYPDMIHPLANAIEGGQYPLGIILCGSGNGAQMPISLPCLDASFPMNLHGRWCKLFCTPTLKEVVIKEELKR